MLIRVGNSSLRIGDPLRWSLKYASPARFLSQSDAGIRTRNNDTKGAAATVFAAPRAEAPLRAEISAAPEFSKHRTAGKLRYDALLSSATSAERQPERPGSRVNAGAKVHQQAGVKMHQSGRGRFELWQEEREGDFPPRPSVELRAERPGGRVSRVLAVVALLRSDLCCA